MNPWQPLDPIKDEIRLFVLEPSSNFDDEIVVHLQTVSLQNPPKYEAISYSWGKTRRKTIIQLDGSQCDIPKRLASCLRHFRGVAERRVFWADAISIDQRDDHDSKVERGAQVSIMNKIFGQATQVRVWTGASDGTLSMPILQAMVRGTKEANEVFQSGGHAVAPSPYLLDIKVDGDQLSGKDLDELNNFLSRDWFSRVWVQQEIALAKSCVIHDGYECVDREVVHCIDSNVKDLEQRHQEGVSRFQDSFHQHFKVFEPLRAMRVALRQDSGIMLVFSDLLSRSRQLKITDERDRVYGLIGLAPEQLRDRVKPNYFKSMARVYQDFALEFINVDQTLSLFANVSYQEESGLPSWVPDWSRPVIRNRTIDQFFSASGSRQIQLDLIELKVLKLSGIQIDTVVKRKKKGGFGGRKDGSNSFPCRYDEWREFFGKSKRYENVEEAYWRTLSHDIFVRRGTKIIRRVDSDFADCARRAANGERDPNIEDFLYSVNRGSGHSSLFVTEKKYFGMGTESMQKGDVVYTLTGGQVCYILRPTGQTDSFKLIGQGYVHGLMDGEIMGEKRAEGVNLHPDLPRTDWKDVYLV